MARLSHTQGNDMKVEGFHNKTGQWVTLCEADDLTYSEKAFVTDFAQGGHSHASIGRSTVHRKHFSAFRIVGEKYADETDIPF
jgi:hypothetical protein